MYNKTILQALPLRERPVERIYTGTQVSLLELLAAIVGGPRQIEIAHELLARFGDLPDLARANLPELMAVPGLGKVGAGRVRAALELAQRLSLAAAGERPQVRSPADAAALLMPEMSLLEQEHFRVLHLDVRNHLLGVETVYVGTVNTTSVRVADVFREAVKRNCAALIVAHNHPSGDPTPSPDDIEVTRRLVAAGEMLGIEVLDHLIVGQQRYVSLRERGLGFGGRW